MGLGAFEPVQAQDDFSYSAERGISQVYNPFVVVETFMDPLGTSRGSKKRKKREQAAAAAAAAAAKRQQQQQQRLEQQRAQEALSQAQRRVGVALGAAESILGWIRESARSLVIFAAVRRSLDEAQLASQAIKLADKAEEEAGQLLYQKLPNSVAAANAMASGLDELVRRLGAVAAGIERIEFEIKLRALRA